MSIPAWADTIDESEDGITYYTRDLTSIGTINGHFYGDVHPMVADDLTVEWMNSHPDIPCREVFSITLDLLDDMISFLQNAKAVLDEHRKQDHN